MLNMNLAVSAALLAVLVLGHSVVGELMILAPLHKARDLPAVRGSVRFTLNTLRFVWHVVTVMGLGMAAILFHLAQMPGLDASQLFVLRALTLTCGAGCVVAFVGSRARHPSWIVLAVITALTWLGAN